MAELINKRINKNWYCDEIWFLGISSHSKSPKIYFRRPRFECGWYWAFNNIVIFTKNMRGWLSFTHIDLKSDNNSLENDYSKNIESCVCDIKELKRILKLLTYYSNKTRRECYYDYFNISYNIIPSLCADLELLITLTNKSKDELIKIYQKQVLDDIRTTIASKRNLLSYYRQYNKKLEYERMKKQYNEYMNETYYFRQIKNNK